MLMQKVSPPGYLLEVQVAAPRQMDSSTDDFGLDYGRISFGLVQVLYV